MTLVWRDRGPDGRALGDWRWAVAGASVWLAPARVGAGWPVAAQALACGDHGGTVWAFWLATALRQHVWRARAGVRGFQPIVEVAIADAKAIAKMGGVAMVRGVAPVAIAPGLLAAWTGWARHRAGEVGSQCLTKS